MTIKFYMYSILILFESTRSNEYEYAMKLNLNFRFKRYNRFKFGDKMKKYRRWGMGGMQLCQKLACIDPCAAIKG